jgi:hypothetical protein
MTASETKAPNEFAALERELTYSQDHVGGAVIGPKAINIIRRALRIAACAGQAQLALEALCVSTEQDAREAFCTVDGQETWPRDWASSDLSRFEEWQTASAALAALKKARIVSNDRTDDR